MERNYVKKFVYILGACLIVVLALTGCSSKKAGDADGGANVPEVTEIDAFVMSVEAVEASYNQNKLVKAEVQNAASQAMVVEGFISEIPELYQDAEYKNKVNKIYNIVNSIDVNKDGLQKEDVDKDFQNLKLITERLNSKFQ